jgi:hypothetical protein
MANRMLDGEFKSSHPDLTIWMDEGDDNDNDGKAKFSEEKSNKEAQDGTDNNNNNNNNTKDGIIRKRSNGDMRTVSIQVPPKRRRLDPSVSTRQLVHGM